MFYLWLQLWRIFFYSENEDISNVIKDFVPTFSIFTEKKTYLIALVILSDLVQENYCIICRIGKFKYIFIIEVILVFYCTTLYYIYTVHHLPCPLD